MDEEFYRQFVDSHRDEFMAFMESKMSTTSPSPTPDLTKEDPECRVIYNLIELWIYAANSLIVLNRSTTSID